MQPVPSDISTRLATLKVLIVDDEPTMRKVTRSLLQAIGVYNVYEARDGSSGLNVVCTRAPDLVLLDWEMPSPNGADFVRQVRSPDNFPLPDVPIIMLTGHGERSRVLEAAKLGVNEFLLKPVSSAALRSRLVSILLNPRRMVRNGHYYGPEPRKLSSYKPDIDHQTGEVFLVV